MTEYRIHNYNVYSRIQLKVNLPLSVLRPCPNDKLDQIMYLPGRQETSTTPENVHNLKNAANNLFSVCFFPYFLTVSKFCFNFKVSLRLSSCILYFKYIV